ncbi:golgi-associated plant pathogenesis-related protein 1 [Caerostris darwini]|uniref:Golgi-associated plant pathogenesis-related protein 1 n=1 Tax=Caerostris darwini TaxID=1538125 RepID=A0AAV4Q7H8_9ARAC|nr:golgi-associated plant pathogenesis-related protein 1 [Caerostris darwini]
MESTEEGDDSCFLPPANSVSLDVEDFRRRMVMAHNGYRELHGSPKLTPLPELEDGAQIWAETIAAKGYLQYCEKLHNIGENLSSIELLSSVPTAERIVHNWYMEIKNFSFAEPRWRRGAFHFTQLVWRNTSHIGIGIAPVPGRASTFHCGSVFSVGEILIFLENSKGMSALASQRDPRVLSTKRPSSGHIPGQEVLSLRMLTSDVLLKS